MWPKNYDNDEPLQLNMTENLTMTNLTDWTWPKNILFLWQWQSLIVEFDQTMTATFIKFWIIFWIGLLSLIKHHSSNCLSLL